MEVWHWLLAAAALLYLFVGYIWGGFLAALTSPGDGSTNWPAILHGLLWPLSLAGLLHRD